LVTDELLPKLELVWGAKAIAQELGVGIRRAFYLLESGALPAKKVQGRWVVERSRLRALFIGEAA
jgi:hypothetical protein